MHAYIQITGGHLRCGRAWPCGQIGNGPADAGGRLDGSDAVIMGSDFYCEAPCGWAFRLAGSARK
jgi:hypothetical protein